MGAFVARYSDAIIKAMLENQNPNKKTNLNEDRLRGPRWRYPDPGEVNLLKQVIVEKTPKPKGFYWLLGLDVLTVVSALAAGYSFKFFVDSRIISPLLVSTGFLIIFSCLGVLLIQSLKRRFLILIFEVIALLFFFYRESLSFLVATGLVVFFIIGFGEVLSRTELLNSVKLRFFRSTTPLAKRTVTALSLLFVLFYLPQWEGGGALISKAWFESAAGWSIMSIESFYPELNLHSNLKDFTTSSAEYQLSKDNSWKVVPPAVKKQVTEQTASQIMTAINKYLGMNLSGKEPVVDVIYNFLTKTFENWRLEFGSWFLFAWAALMFLLVRSIGTVFWWLIIFLAFVIYELFLGLDIIYVRGESVMRETIEFS